MVTFINFLKGEETWQTYLKTAADELATVEWKRKNVIKSLLEDINREAVETAGQNPEGALALEPWMAGEYLEGAMPLIARELLHKAVAGIVLNSTEYCAVRNSLALQLMLTNFKRAGDVANLTREAVTTAKYEDDGGQEFYVSILF